MKHAFVRCEVGGTISIRWWVDGPSGVATRAIFHVHPGERMFDVPYESWQRFDGEFVDIDDVRRAEQRSPEAG
jgi:hypothetical protein